MNKYSVVIDSETISYWKFLLISKLYDEQKIDCFYIVNKKQSSLSLSIKRFTCKGLSLITTSELFGEVPKIYVSQTSQFSGDLVWLSEEKINFEYNNDIYFFADTDGSQKLSIHWLMLQSQKLSLLQTCIRSKKHYNKNQLSLD